MDKQQQRTIVGFKIIRRDGTTYKGYKWPIPEPGKRIRVEATNPTIHDSECPRHEGDGLCVALTAQAASSSNIPLSDSIGLWLEYKESDILATHNGKCRVSAVTVIGTFNPMEWIKVWGAGSDLSHAKMFCADLSYSNLSYANLFCADLSHADLSHADMSYADMSHVDLSHADMSYADMSHVDLFCADLSYADMSYANLSHTDLTGAILKETNLRGAVGRTDWDDLVARGAIR